MPRIHILDSYLINKIAAGEVIEGPASVVKELIENSIDASSTNITVELKEGGKSLIKVGDNGTGMDDEDAMLCFERHATSKIRSNGDLSNIRTLGFRGEALSSIAAVSNLRITTKQAERLEGYFIEVEGGKLINSRKTGCGNGTTIEVNNLFFNTPARKKYLKEINYELSKVIDVITRYALINNNISFRLSHNNRTILNSPRTNSLIDNIITIYGKDSAKQLIEIKCNRNKIEVYGFISKPALTRADKSQQSIFVNQRWIKNNIINNAVYDAYKTLLFGNRHPVFILMIGIEPSKLDVNVHPAKEIVRLSDEEEVYKAVFEGVKSGLEKHDLSPEISPEVEIMASYRRDVQRYPFSRDKQSLLMVRDRAGEERSAESPGYGAKERVGERGGFAPCLIIGQINRTYILAENNKGLLIIDQHAAQERILYEEFIEKYRNNSIKKQSLIKPQVIELSLRESDILMSHLDLFNQLGFDIEGYSKNSFLVRAVPYIFERFSKDLLTDILAELGNINLMAVNVSEIMSHDEIKEERIIRFACRKAIKAGAELTKPVMESLIEALEKARQPYTCPHGRPTMINISLSELERKFKRK